MDRPANNPHVNRIALGLRSWWNNLDWNTLGYSFGPVMFVFGELHMEWESLTGALSSISIRADGGINWAEDDFEEFGCNVSDLIS